MPPTSIDWLKPHLKGHVFLFGSRSPAGYDASAGLRLLLIFLLLEGIVGPRYSLLRWLELPVPAPWLRTLLLLGLALVLVRSFARLELSRIGLVPWRDWGRIEKSYFLQVILLVTVVFSIIFARRLQRIVEDESLWGVAGGTFLTYFVWGFYQELMYRGILQTELVRRWGSLAGILVTNILFTFGPLHFYHFSGAAPVPVFVAIFAIGLFFGVLFWRSGNLWIVGVFHGIGDVFFTGLATIVGANAPAL